jgi:hypothetical protein
MSRPMKQWKRSIFIVMLFLGACNDTPAEPSTEEMWTYIMLTERLNDTPQPGDAQCQIVGANLTLLREDGEFQGTVDGTMTCAVIGSIQFSFDQQVTAGVVAADSVGFRIGTWEHRGRLSNGSMSGTATIDVVIDGAATSLNGVWAAARQ